MSAPPRPDMAYLKALARVTEPLLKEAGPLHKAIAYIEHLEARCKELERDAELARAMGIEDAREVLADLRELEREARD